MAWAVQNPTKVARITLMNTAAFFPPLGKKLPWQLYLLKRFPGLARFAILCFNLFAKGALYFAAARRLEPAVKAGYLAPYNTPHNRLATLRFVLDIPTRPQDASYEIVQQTDERLDRLSSHPCQLIWGDRDFVFDRDYFNEWRRRFPLAETHYFDKAGHYVLEDESESAIAVIQRFLKMN
jgi:haloalkane dehalogenase